jgi:hypothetical protein
MLIIPEKRIENIRCQHGYQEINREKKVKIYGGYQILRIPIIL